MTQMISILTECFDFFFFFIQFSFVLPLQFLKKGPATGMMLFGKHGRTARSHSPISIIIDRPQSNLIHECQE